MKAGDALQPTTTATTVRVRDGKTLRTDGPFAETKEQLGGYYLVEAKDLDEATKLAARIPGARTGSIEVRPVMELPTGYPRPGGARSRSGYAPARAADGRRARPSRRSSARSAGASSRR